MLDLRDMNKIGIDAIKSLRRLGWVALILAAALFVVIMVIFSLNGGAMSLLAGVAFAAALPAAVACAVGAALQLASALEDEEKRLLAKSREVNALDVSEDVRFTAGRTYRNFYKYAPYVFALLTAAAIVIYLSSVFNIWRKPENYAVVGNAIHVALILAVSGCVGVFGGVFFVGQSRMSGFRWLRPCGAWLLVGGLGTIIAAVAAICVHNGIVGFDLISAKVFYCVFVVLAAEQVVNFVTEFYRPESGREPRPVFESGLIALFLEPGGIARNIAMALDYQFGFQVSGTWFYHFIERAFLPTLLLWFFAFWLFTGIYEITPGQVGVRETFGKASPETLAPGVYFSLPTPLGKIRTFDCSTVRRLVIGETPVSGGKKTPRSKVALWTDAHGEENERFLVAVKPEEGAKDGDDSVSISFLRVSIPIMYRIKPEGVRQWGYSNSSPEDALKKIGESVATEYFASSSMSQVMSIARAETEKVLFERIQAEVDKNYLGIEIVAVNLLDAHPPVEKVAPAYQNVICAMEEKETKILEAAAYAAGTLPEAEAAAAEKIAVAEAERHKTRSVAAADSAWFVTQEKLSRISPELYRLRHFLDFMESECGGVRKYVMSSDVSKEVLQFNFETKERLDLIDADLSKLSKQE